MTAFRMRPLGAVGAVAAAYGFLFGALLWWRLAGDVGDGILSVAPAIVVIALAFTSQADRRQYVVRIFAAMAFLPLGLMMWAGSHDRGGLWLLWFALVHVIVFLAMVVWLASFATRIDPAGHVAPVGADVLRRRLESLAAAIPSVAMGGAERDRWIVDLRAQEPEGRTHRIVLQVDEGRREVRVREFLGAAGAAPADHEKDLRAAGEAWFDPSRPEAQAVWSKTLQSTMIEPDRLERAPLKLDMDRAELLEGGGGLIDGEALVTLLAALVARSGYVWRPQLLSWAFCKST